MPMSPKPSVFTFAERLDRQKGESRSVSRHIRGMDDLANERPEVSRVADLR
jgi:hypothetical protein